MQLLDHGNSCKLWVIRFDAANFCHILGWDDTLHLSRRKAEQRTPDFVESLHETRRPQEVWPPVTCHSKILHGHVLGVGSWTLIEDIPWNKPMPRDFGLLFKRCLALGLFRPRIESPAHRGAAQTSLICCFFLWVLWRVLLSGSNLRVW